MKSYILGIVVAMVLSAAYALSNTAEITIKFLNIQASFSQGIWEIIMFSIGALAMWVISVCASVEAFMKNRKKTKELNKRISQLEDERKTLLSTLQSFGWKDHSEPEIQALPEPKTISRAEEKEPAVEQEPEDQDLLSEETPAESPESKKQEQSPELTKTTEQRPSFLKGILSSVFGRTKNPQENAAAIPEEKPEITDVICADEQDNCAAEYEHETETYNAENEEKPEI